MIRRLFMLSLCATLVVVIGTARAASRPESNIARRNSTSNVALPVQPAQSSVREADFPSPLPARKPHREVQQPAPIRSAPPVTYNGDHEALWLCVHSYEGSWTDPNAPYFGGLQMGYGFMEAYAPHLYATLGTADHWTPDQQIAVAEGAWKINGYSVTWLYSQWPISGPDCI